MIHLQASAGKYCIALWMSLWCVLQSKLDTDILVGSVNGFGNHGRTPESIFQFEILYIVGPLGKSTQKGTFDTIKLQSIMLLHCILFQNVNDKSRVCISPYIPVHIGTASILWLCFFTYPRTCMREVRRLIYQYTHGQEKYRTTHRYIYVS